MTVPAGTPQSPRVRDIQEDNRRVGRRYDDALEKGFDPCDCGAGPAIAILERRILEKAPLMLYALRHIAADDEIVFDYSTCMNERGSDVIPEECPARL